MDYALDRCIDAYYNDKAWFRSMQVSVGRSGEHFDFFLGGGGWLDDELVWLCRLVYRVSRGCISKPGARERWRRSGGGRPQARLAPIKPPIHHASPSVLPGCFQPLLPSCTAAPRTFHTYKTIAGAHHASGLELEPPSARLRRVVLRSLPGRMRRRVVATGAALPLDSGGLVSAF
jgi:hypothetical protein